MRTINTSRQKQFGFTIIEAMTALAVMGFGILGLAGLQATLSRNADVAKQRTEAVRLAEEKIEELRSYTGIDNTIIGPATISTTALNWNALANGNDSITTNAVYTRTWTLDNTVADPMRGLMVNVVWTDRVGDTQTVTLSSIIAKINPADAGFLGFPLPTNSHTKRPKNRNLDIPIPAIDLGTGKSAIKFGTSGQYVLFNNLSGNIVDICTPTLQTETTTEIVTVLNDSTKSNCTPIKGYIIAGYVNRYTGRNNEAGTISNSDWNAIKNNLGIDLSNISRNAAGNTAMSCQFDDALNQSTGTTIENSKYYLCIIPLTEPSPSLTTNGPYHWSGTIKIAGPTAWNTSSAKYYVCRYEYTATGSLTDSNQRNVQPYSAVNKSIDQQNYLIATGANATCPEKMTVDGVSTGVLHQNCSTQSPCPVR